MKKNQTPCSHKIPVTFFYSDLAICNHVCGNPLVEIRLFPSRSAPMMRGRGGRGWRSSRRSVGWHFPAAAASRHVSRRRIASRRLRIHDTLPLVLLHPIVTATLTQKTTVSSVPAALIASTTNQPIPLAFPSFIFHRVNDLPSNIDVARVPVYRELEHVDSNSDWFLYFRPSWSHKRVGCEGYQLEWTQGMAGNKQNEIHIVGKKPGSGLTEDYKKLH